MSFRQGLASQLVFCVAATELKPSSSYYRILLCQGLQYSGPPTKSTLLRFRIRIPLGRITPYTIRTLSPKLCGSMIPCVGFGIGLVACSLGFAAQGLGVSGLGIRVWGSRWIARFSSGSKMKTEFTGSVCARTLLETLILGVDGPE